MRLLNCLCLWVAVGATISPSPAGEFVPDGTDATRRVLWSFAWVSDMHINASNLEYTTGALRYIDGELKPHFVLLTGDNNAHPAPQLNRDAGETIGLRRQRFLKAFLEEHLNTPYVIIPGDNWPQEFDKVFGPKQYSFDFGGLHFLLLAPDRILSGPGREGLSVFDPATWDWIEQDLERSRGRPTIVAIHEPVFPPTFLDAPRLRRLLARYPDVVAVLQGHLHMDLQLRADGKTYLVAPSLERPPRPGMKLVDVHPTSLVVRTILHNAPDDRFEMQDRLQHIAIPPALRGALAAPAHPGFTMDNYDAIPARPLAEDPSLESRAGELLGNAARSLLPTKLERPQ
ncbi:MAG: metallophosphoesterase [Thermoguttaceae bacterium]|jgi:hypothetical protein|nr:metallophosphoesterase [Thermoguttaceae bacterium]